MMKKSFFMKSFNSSIFLIAQSLVCCLLSVLFKIIITNLSSIELIYIDTLSIYIKKICSFLSTLSQFSIALSLTLILIELAFRFKKDNILNYFKSIYQTVLLKRFLVQNEDINTLTTTDTQTNMKENKVLGDFNKAARQCIIDVRNENITIFIKVPQTQQAQKLLKNMEQQIKEELSSNNPDYFFSSSTRIKRHIWFEGKKR